MAPAMAGLRGRPAVIAACYPLDIRDVAYSNYPCTGTYWKGAPMQPRNPTPALLSLSLGYFTMGTTSLAVVGLNVQIGHSLHVAPAHVGLLVTIFAVTFAVAAPLAPAVLNRLDRKRALLLGLALLTAGGVAGAVAPSYSLLAASRVLGALGGAIVGPTASAM